MFEIKDEDIIKLLEDYKKTYIEIFRDEYRISDLQFGEMVNELKVKTDKQIYEILKLKKKCIFDIILENDIIVLYNDDQIEDLCKVLNYNNIKCNCKDFISYNWVRFDFKSIREFANFGPINQNCKIFKFDEFINIVQF